MKSSVILQPQTTATHRLQRKRYIVIKMQGKCFIHFLQEYKNYNKIHPYLSSCCGCLFPNLLGTLPYPKTQLYIFFYDLIMEL